MKIIVILAATLSFGLGAQETTAVSSSLFNLQEGSTQNMTQIAFGSLSSQRTKYEDDVFDDKKSKSLHLGVTYGRQFETNKNFQALGRLSLSYRDYESSGWSKSSGLWAGIGYNFSQELIDSFFINALLGAHDFESKSNSYSYNSFSVEGGKRFSLGSLGLNFVSYSPYIAYVVQEYKSRQEREWNFNFLIFDFFF